MSDPPGEPVGYCPHCDYPMNGGTCAECGRVTPTGKLPKTSGRPKALKRILKSLCGLLLLSVAIVGLRYVDWMAWLPNGFLLRMMESSDDRWGQEILNRIADGGLSSAQRQQYLSDFMSPPTFETRSCYPVETPILLRLASPVSPIVHLTDAQFGEWELLVDGVVVADSVVGDAAQLPRHEDHCRAFWCPPLPAGRHKVRLQGLYSIVAPGHGSHWSGVRIETEQEIEAELLVEGRLSDIVQMHYSVESSLSARKGLSASIMTGDEFGKDIVLRIAGHQLPSPVGGVVLVRPSGAVGFAAIGRAFISDGEAAYLTLTDVFGMSDAREVEVRINPDPAYAYCCRASVIFGGVVEWEHVPLARNVNIRDFLDGVSPQMNPAHIISPGEMLPLE